jgi:hypothetical protein
VRLQLFPLNECEFPVVQEGSRATFSKECRPKRDYEADVDLNGVVTGTTLVRVAQQGCRIELEVLFSYAMGTSPTSGDYTLRWVFSSSCRPLLSCEQTLRTTLTRSPDRVSQPGASSRTTIEREKSGRGTAPSSTRASCQRSRQGEVARVAPADLDERFHSAAESEPTSIRKLAAAQRRGGPFAPRRRRG